MPILGCITRREFGSLVLAGWLAHRTGVAEDKQLHELKFHVKDEFGSATPADVLAVIKSAAQEIWRHCPHTRFDASFTIYRSLESPLTHFKRDDDNRIVIGLDTRDLFWAQYAFQFAHEFCHALMDHSNDPALLWRRFEHANKWLEESLCETASLFTLRAMSKSWETNPPYRNWKSFALHLATYAEERMRKQPLPADIPFAKWFAEQQASLRKNGVQRDKNTIVATQLLPLFEDQPADWEAIPAFTLGGRNVQQPLAGRLAEWKANVREELRPFVAKVAAALEVQL